MKLPFPHRQQSVHMTERIRALVSQGAIFYCSHSGGKDSQAMYAELSRIVPHDQLRVVHADLGEIEWCGVKDHIMRNIDDHELIIAQAIHADGSPKDFFSAVRARRESLDKQGKVDAPAFPSSASRFCTSDLKTNPIWKVCKADARQTKSQIIVNCVGIRGEESPRRAKVMAKRGTFNINKKHSNGLWTCYDWWPIAEWTIESVWAAIETKGQKPHWAYATGNERLSCVFCIFGSANDLGNGHAARPGLFEKYAELERDVRSTMFYTQSIVDKIPIRKLAA